MLKLINIKMNDDILEADYIPEDSNKKAHVSVNKNTGEITAEVIDEYGKMYSRMAVNGLDRIWNELKSKKISSLPEERLVMWF